MFRNCGAPKQNHTSNINSPSNYFKKGLGLGLGLGFCWWMRFLPLPRSVLWARARARARARVFLGLDFALPFLVLFLLSGFS